MHSNSIRNNAVVIGAGIAVALSAWVFVRLVHVDPVVGKGNNPGEVGPVDAVVAALMAGLAACAVHAVLVRWHRVRWWPLIGSTALAVSITGPSYLADGESALALIGMHVAVGAVLIGGLGILGAGERRCEEEPAQSTRHVPQSS